MTTMMLIETWLKKNFILIHVGMSRFAFCKIVRLKYFLLFVALLPHLIGLFYPMIDDIKICHFFAWLVRMNYGCSFFFFTKQSSWLDNLRNQNSNQGNSVPLLLQKKLKIGTVQHHSQWVPNDWMKNVFFGLIFCFTTKSVSASASSALFSASSRWWWWSSPTCRKLRSVRTWLEKNWFGRGTKSLAEEQKGCERIKKEA